MSEASTEDISRAVLDWVNSFNLTNQAESLKSLCDGVVISQMLNNVGSDYFPTDGIEGSDNWVMRASNIRKILRLIESYYTNVLSKGIDIISVNVNNLARDGDEDEIIGLLELVLGLAVQCEERATFIQAITALDEMSQLILKSLVERAMGRITVLDESSSSSSSSSSNSSEELIQAQETIKRLQEERQRLLAQTGNLEANNVDLNDQVIKLNEQLESQEAEKAMNQGSERGRVAALEATQAQLQMELDETKRDLDLKIVEIEDLQIDNDKITKQLNTNKDMQAKMATESRLMADELDIAKDKASKLVKMEAMVEKYQKKLEELPALKKTNKELESKLDGYLDQITELENNNQTLGSVNKMIDTYKDAKVELESKNFELRSTIELKEAELTRKQQALDSSLGEKRRIEEELDSSRKEWEARMNTLQGEAKSSGPDEEQELEIHSLKESLTKAGLEIASLKESLTNTSGAAEVTAAKTLMLENEIEGIRSALNEREESLTTSMKKVSELEQELQGSKSEIMTLKQNASESVKAVESSANDQAVQLQQQIEAKERTTLMLEEKLKDMEGRNNKLVQDKTKLEAFAKNSLSNFKDRYVKELSRFRAEKKEWKDKYTAIAKINDRNQETYRREERLLLSSMYEIGVRILDRNIQSTMRTPATETPTFLQNARAEQERRSSVSKPN